MDHGQCKMKEEGIIEYETLAVTLKDLEEYGAEVVRYINKETSEKALLVLSRASTKLYVSKLLRFF